MTSARSSGSSPSPSRLGATVTVEAAFPLPRLNGDAAALVAGCAS